MNLVKSHTHNKYFTFLYNGGTDGQQSTNRTTLRHEGSSTITDYEEEHIGTCMMLMPVLSGQSPLSPHSATVLVSSPCWEKKRYHELEPPFRGLQM